MLEEAKRIDLNKFMGIYSKGEDDDVPSDHFVDAQNLVFDPGRVATRPGTAIRFTFTGGTERTTFAEFSNGAATPTLFSMDSNGNLYKDNNPAPVATIAGATSFAAVQYFNKLFICPRNGKVGVGNIYIYDKTTNTVREAGGAAPGAVAPMVVTDGPVGDVPAGDYKVAVCYETDTGFLTPPGPVIATVFSPTSYTAPGNLQINVTDIPIGPANIVARQILITKADGAEYFFVSDLAGGYIDDNTTTSTSLNFFVTDLIESADYLFNLRETIPSGAGVGIFAARLLLWGFVAPDGSLLRLSRVGDPESFDQTLESVIVQKYDGYDIVNTVKLRDILYIFKDLGIHASSDNGDDPVNWDVFVVDNAIGSTILGISTVSPTVGSGSHNDTVTIIDKTGYWLFNGVVQQPDLSYKISKLWNLILDYTPLNPFVDVKNKVIYIVGYNGGILVADYGDGYSPQLFKWCPFYFYEADGITKKVIACAALLDAIGGGDPVLCWMFVNDLNIYQFDDSVTRDVGNGIINSDLTIGSIGFGGMNILKGIRVRVNGVNNLFIKAIGHDSVSYENLKTQQLNTIPGRELVAYSRFMSERIYLKFESNELDAWFDIGRVIYYGDVLYAERPL